MRFFYVLVFIIIAIVEIGPIPITPVLLIYVLIFRPTWFYCWVQKIYDK